MTAGLTAITGLQLLPQQILTQTGCRLPVRQASSPGVQQQIHAVRRLSSAQPRTFTAGKLALLEQICCDLGVHTAAQQVEGLWIVPLKSWYHSSFDREPDIPGSLSAERVSLCSLSGGIWSTHTALTAASKAIC